MVKIVQLAAATALMLLAGSVQADNSGEDDMAAKRDDMPVLIRDHDE